jgi:hypothetical protein
MGSTVPFRRASTTTRHALRLELLASSTQLRLNLSECMKTTKPSNGLSVRANKCLALAGVAAEKEAVLHALNTGELFPFLRPTL